VGFGGSGVHQAGKVSPSGTRTGGGIFAETGQGRQENLKKYRSVAVNFLKKGAEEARESREKTRITETYKKRSVQHMGEFLFVHIGLILFVLFAQFAGNCRI
jgi:hypothetical protein